MEKQKPAHANQKGVKEPKANKEEKKPKIEPSKATDKQRAQRATKSVLSPRKQETPSKTGKSQSPEKRTDNQSKKPKKNQEGSQVPVYLKKSIESKGYQEFRPQEEAKGAPVPPQPLKTPDKPALNQSQVSKKSSRSRSPNISKVQGPVVQENGAGLKEMDENSKSDIDIMRKKEKKTKAQSKSPIPKKVQVINWPFHFDSFLLEIE